MNRNGFLLSITGGIFFGIDLALWNTSVMLGNASISTLLANNAPIWVAIGGLIIFKEKLDIKFFAGLILAMTGMMLVSTNGNLSELNFKLYQILAIIAGLFYAMYLLTTQKVRQDASSRAFLTVVCYSGTLVLMIISLFSGYKLFQFGFTSWLSLIGLALISQLAGWLAINYTLGHISATTVSVTLLAQVVVTSVLAYIIFGESLSIIEFTGFLLVMAGITTVNLRKVKKV